jgi:putative sterol carrier protein
MNQIVDEAVRALNARLPGGEIDGTIRFVIEGAGVVLIDGRGATVGDGDADCTLTADADTFRELLEGELDPTTAFMSGRLAIDGDMGLAMRLGTLLT